MNIGRMIFYDKITGEVIVNTGEWINIPRKKTVSEQIITYPALSERNEETFDVLELEFGQYSKDFTESNGYRVNTETKELEFSYSNETEEEPVYQKPLSVEVERLKAEDLNNKEAIAELYLLSMGGF